MRAALIADLHANLPALRAVLEDAAKIGCETVWCAGDVVGRGPHPNDVVDMLRALDIPTVQGNWDEAVGMDRDESGAVFAGPAAEEQGSTSLSWTRRVITDENRAWLRNLPTNQRFTVEGRSILLFHGSPLKATEYLWADRPSRYFARIASDEADDLFCFGHTHESFHRIVGQSHFVAAGSVGCGLDGDSRARYAVVYIGQPDVAVGFRSVEYDERPVLAALRGLELSEDLLRVPPTAHPPTAHPPTVQPGGLELAAG